MYEGLGVEKAVALYLERGSRSGDYELLLDSAKKYVEGIVSRIVNSVPNVLSREDLIQEGVIGFIYALQTYDPEKGTFVTWSFPRIRGMALNAIHKFSPSSRNSSVHFVSLDEDWSEEFQSLGDTVEDIYYPKADDVIDSVFTDELCQVLKELVWELPPPQRALILLHLNGVKVSRLSAIFEMSDSYIFTQKREALHYLTRRMTERIDDTFLELKDG